MKRRRCFALPYGPFLKQKVRDDTVEDKVCVTVQDKIIQFTIQTEQAKPDQNTDISIIISLFLLLPVSNLLHSLLC